MERRFKVHVYTEGEPPIAHDGPCKDIYSMEGRFIHEMEQGAVAKRFKTKDPQRAHVHFMPFSVTWMVRYLYTPLSHDIAPLRWFVSDYVRLVSTKYPFWNRTRGADHFMLACHDWVKFLSTLPFSPFRFLGPSILSLGIRILMFLTPLIVFAALCVCHCLSLMSS